MGKNICNSADRKKSYFVNVKDTFKLWLRKKQTIIKRARDMNRQFIKKRNKMLKRR